MRETRLAQIASDQHNVFTRHQALECGFSSSTIDRRVCRGAWDRAGRSTLVVAGASPTAFTELAIAILEVGETALAGRMSAIALHGCALPPSPPQINVHESQRMRRRISANIFSTWALDDIDICRRHGLPATTIERALIDIAGSEPRAIVEDTLDTALRKRLTTLDRIETRACDLRERGRAGPRLIIELIEDRSPKSQPTESVLEDRWERIARQIPGFSWRRQVSRTLDGAPVRIDFVCEEHRIVIETDGWATHGTKRQFEADHRRRTALAADGYSVLTFTWDDVTRRPDWVTDQIRKALARD